MTDTNQPRNLPIDIDGVINSIPTGMLLYNLKNGMNTLSIMLFTLDKTVVYANNMAANGISGETADSLPGKNLNDLLPKDWLAERNQYFEKAIETNRVITVLEIIEGVRLSSRIKSLVIEHEGEKQTLIMYTIEPVKPADITWIRKHTPAEDLFDAEFIDLGLLNLLSERELEVLALMGIGLRQKEIAERLFRSVSTINRHRESIGEKLGVTDRAVLIQLASQAGLEVEDASKTRMNLNDQNSVIRHYKNKLSGNLDESH
jgi:DNA-binding CsgD family transcriptional regulator